MDLEAVSSGCSHIADGTIFSTPPFHALGGRENPADSGCRRTEADIFRSNTRSDTASSILTSQSKDVIHVGPESLCRNKKYTGINGS